MMEAETPCLVTDSQTLSNGSEMYICTDNTPDMPDKANKVQEDFTESDLYLCIVFILAVEK